MQAQVDFENVLQTAFSHGGPGVTNCELGCMILIVILGFCFFVFVFAQSLKTVYITTVTEYRWKSGEYAPLPNIIRYGVELPLNCFIFDFYVGTILNGDGAGQTSQKVMWKEIKCEGVLSHMHQCLELIPLENEYWKITGDFGDEVYQFLAIKVHANKTILNKNNLWSVAQKAGVTIYNTNGNQISSNLVYSTEYILTGDWNYDTSLLKMLYLRLSFGTKFISENYMSKTSSARYSSSSLGFATLLDKTSGTQEFLSPEHTMTNNVIDQKCLNDEDNCYFLSAFFRADDHKKNYNIQPQKSFLDAMVQSGGMYYALVVAVSVLFFSCKIPYYMCNWYEHVSRAVEDSLFSDPWADDIYSADVA